MFGLFGDSKKPKLTVTIDDKNWVESNILWLGEVFGFERVMASPFLLPEFKTFPYTDVRKEDQLEALFCQLCEVFEVKREEISFLLYDDEETKWTVGDSKSTAGYFVNESDNSIKKYRVFISKENFENLERLIAVMAHEIAHVKLLGGKFISANDPDHEGFTDLAVIFFGFGLLAANGAFMRDATSLSRTGYLPDEVIAYANALICYISGKDEKFYAGYLSLHAKPSFERNYNYLVQTNDTLLEKQAVAEINHLYSISKLIIEAIENKDYNKLLTESEKYNALKEKATNYNNIGYAHLMLGDFEAAINSFDKAIHLDPFWDYPFDNRGFCKLQVGDLEGAYTDITTALEFDDTNAYTWRTLGLYHLLKGQPDKALEYLDKAYGIDAFVDLQHFFYAIVYKVLGDIDKHNYHQNKSVEINETTPEFLKHNRIG